MGGDKHVREQHTCVHSSRREGGEYSGLVGEEGSDLGSGTKAEATVQKVVGILNEYSMSIP